MKNNMVLFANVTACLQAIWRYFTSNYNYRDEASILSSPCGGGNKSKHEQN